MSAIALAANWVIRLFLPACSTFEYPLDHLFALADAYALIGFSTVFALFLSAKVLVSSRAIDEAFLEAKGSLTAALSGVAGVLCAVSFVLAAGGYCKLLLPAIVITAAAFIAVAAGNFDFSKIGRPLTGKRKVGAASIIFALAALFPLAGLWLVQPPQRPHGACPPAAERAN